MRLLTLILFVFVLCACANAQFFRNFFSGINNMFRGNRGGNRFGPRPNRPFFTSGGIRPGGFRGSSGSSGGNPAHLGTKSPVATGRDETYPTNCGRDPKKNTGLLCFPDGKLCENRLNRRGIERYGNHNYWFSWNSDDNELRNAKWDWFNARNYCRKRCMDLVSFETRDEYEWIKQRMSGVKYIWTSGRLCNFDGCDEPRFRPKNINGWFWSANQVTIPPTNQNSGSSDWSNTGGSGVRQPDDREHKEGGEEEACLAVLNNFYGDGIKWHDVACSHEKPIVCEDVEGHLQFARNNFPNINIP